MNGAAVVLREQGNLREAEDIISATISLFPSDPVARCSYAEILRTKGDLEGALDVYRYVKENSPTIPVAYSGYAEVLRDMKRLDEATSAYQEASNLFPRDCRIANGYANVLKVNDDLEDLSVYMRKTFVAFPTTCIASLGARICLSVSGNIATQSTHTIEILKRWPHWETARNGKAAVLVIKGQFDQALALIPSERPSTQSDWIAWHIRGMIFLRRNQIKEAVAFFEDGRQTTPLRREKRYFESALSAAKLRDGKPDEAALALVEAGTPLPTILRLHAFSAMGNTARATSIYRLLVESCPPRLVDLRDAIAVRYEVINAPDAHNDNWIFQRECEALLQEAA